MKKIMQNKTQFKIYLIIIVSLIVISLILSLTSLTLLESFRITFGSVFVLFLPGYVITHLFLKDLDLIEKIALSFALSIAIVPLTIFYLNRIGMKINTLNSLISIISIILISFLIKAIKRKIVQKQFSKPSK